MENILGDFVDTGNKYLETKADEKMDKLLYEYVVRKVYQFVLEHSFNLNEIRTSTGVYYYAGQLAMVFNITGSEAVLRIAEKWPSTEIRKLAALIRYQVFQDVLYAKVDPKEKEKLNRLHDDLIDAALNVHEQVRVITDLLIEAVYSFSFQVDVLVNYETGESVTVAHVAKS